MERWLNQYLASIRQVNSIQVPQLVPTGSKICLQTIGINKHVSTAYVLQMARRHWLAVTGARLGPAQRPQVALSPRPAQLLLASAKLLLASGKSIFTLFSLPSSGVGRPRRETHMH